MLLTAQADALITDKDGFSALHLAAESGNLASIKILLESMKTGYTSGGWSELITEVKSIVVKNHESDTILKFLERWNLPIESVLKGEAFPIHTAVGMANKSQVN